ncbi:MAG TPA: hypothetical protein PKE55_07285 [Kiritimatiellia bacterium]|nr:hypothetical protein [Kiritimatiellia bacterium]
MRIPFCHVPWAVAGWGGVITLGMGKTITTRGWIIAACLIGMLAVLPPAANAALVDLDIQVSFPLLDENDVPLADGSWVFVYGSLNDVADPMDTWGTNVIAGSTTGDDVILAAFQLTSGADFGVDGFFFTTVKYDPTLVNFAYIRFFNSSGPLTGMIYWGESLVYTITPPPLGAAQIDFAPTESLSTTNLDNFVIIPEPSTFNLVLLVGCMMWGMRASMRRSIKAATSKSSERPEQTT